MTFTELGYQKGPTLLLLPGTCCNWEMNFATVLQYLAKYYHLICVNYDGFDGRGGTFTNVLTITGKIEDYILVHFQGKIDGALGSSLGGSFVAQLILRHRIHITHGIIGGSDFDQTGRIRGRIQSTIAARLLNQPGPFHLYEWILRKMLLSILKMDNSTATRFIQVFHQFHYESVWNEYFSDLITPLPNAAVAPDTQVHIIYAEKMGISYLKRYRKYFTAPDIHPFPMQHEEWLFGNNGYQQDVLKDIYAMLNPTKT